jgi:hypothetical protein
MKVLYSNNAASTLASGINSTATSMTVASGTGGVFPNPGAGEYFYVTLANDDETTLEIVKVTARTNDVLTIERGFDGTTSSSFLTAAKVELRITKIVLDSIDSYHDDRTINALGSVSGTTDIDLANGTNVTATIAEATTFTISGITSGSVNTVTLYLTNAGAYTITWPSGTTFNRNAAPVLPASGDTIIVLETYDNATSYAGIQVWRSV